MGGKEANERPKILSQDPARWLSTISTHIENAGGRSPGVLIFKLGHCEIQIRPLRVKVGQHPGPRGNIGKPEHFLIPLRAARSDRMSVLNAPIFAFTSPRWKGDRVCIASRHGLR